METAKALLEDAGVTKGSFTIEYNSARSYERDIAEYAKSVWKELGFTVQTSGKNDRYLSGFITGSTSLTTGTARVIGMDFQCITPDAYSMLMGFSTQYSGGAVDLSQEEITFTSGNIKMCIRDRTYRAWVQVSDQGALGGDSCVKVRNIKKEFFTGLGTFKKRDAVLYFGGWGESYDLQWEDNNTLLVNGKKYNIPNFLLENRFDKMCIRDRNSSKKQVAAICQRNMSKRQKQHAVRLAVIHMNHVKSASEGNRAHALVVLKKADESLIVRKT